MTQQNPTLEGWEERFLDFYFEKREYKDRPLGPEQYIKFIRTLITAAKEEERKRILEKVEAELNKKPRIRQFEHEYIDTCDYFKVFQKLRRDIINP